MLWGLNEIVNINLAESESPGDVSYTVGKGGNCVSFIPDLECAWHILSIRETLEELNWTKLMYSNVLP